MLCLFYTSRSVVSVLYLTAATCTLLPPIVAGYIVEVKVPSILPYMTETTEYTTTTEHPTEIIKTTQEPTEPTQSTVTSTESTTTTESITTTEPTTATTESSTTTTESATTTTEATTTIGAPTVTECVETPDNPYCPFVTTPEAAVIVIHGDVTPTEGYIGPNFTTFFDAQELVDTTPLSSSIPVTRAQRQGGFLFKEDFA